MKKFKIMRQVRSDLEVEYYYTRCGKNVWWYARLIGGSRKILENFHLCGTKDALNAYLKGFNFKTI